MRSRRKTVPSDRVFIAAEPEWIAGVMTHIREHHGDAEAYLTHHGVAPGELAALRAALVTTVEPASSAMA